MSALDKLPPPVRSVEELMSLAEAMEREAALRYRELAERMRLRAEVPLADLFAFLASIEEKHATQIAERAGQDGNTAAALNHAGWEVPENFDEEAGSSRLLTPYAALAIAVRNEDRAFAFYSYVAAQAVDPQTQQVAEALAQDELAHAWLLRRERRKAYRAESAAGVERAVADVPGTVPEFRAFAVETELHAAAYHRGLAGALAQAHHPAAALFGDAAAEEEGNAREAGGGTGPEAGTVAEFTIEGGLRLLEETFQRYVNVAERSRDEGVVHEAQRYAARAVRRLTLVHGSIGNVLLHDRQA